MTLLENIWTGLQVALRLVAVFGLWLLLVAAVVMAVMCVRERITYGEWFPPAQ